MKVMHIASGDLWAGAEVQLFHLARSLVKEKDIQLSIVLLNHGQLERELINQGISVTVFDEEQVSGFSIFKSIYKLIKDNRPDIVHTHRNKENVIGGFAAKLNGVKSIRTVHGASELQHGKFNLKRFIFDSLDKLAALFAQQKIVAVSKDLWKKLSGVYPDSKLVIIDNCVDTDYILGKSAQTLIQNVDEHSYNIAFIGRFVPVKRVDLFYDIAKKVVLCKNKGRSIDFHMIGDGPLKMDIEERVKNDALGNHIHLHGFVENTAPLLKKMDLLVFTSEHEGLPMTLLEAMTLGVPVLSGYLPSLKDALCDGDCGYILSPDSVDDYCDLILALAESGLDSASKAKMAQQQINSRFNIKSNVLSYLTQYRSMLQPA